MKEGNKPNRFDSSVTPCRRGCKPVRFWISGYTEQRIKSNELITEANGYPGGLYIYELSRWRQPLELNIMMQEFNLWLEFEEVSGPWNHKNDFCNIQVALPDGRHYGINVWTFGYLQTSIQDDKHDGKKLNGLYQVPPDLFVQELTRECIERVIADILKTDDLEKVLNPSVIAIQH